MTLTPNDGDGPRMDDLESGLAYYRAIPTRMHGPITRYVYAHRQPGDFLTAVLSNNLIEAVSRADAENQVALADWVKLVYNHLPSNCWGTPGRVRAWVTEGQSYWLKVRK
jgi:hypothetical protein